MTHLTGRSALTAAVFGLAGLVTQADAQLLVVTNGDTLTLTEAGDSPFFTDGASIGNDPALFSGPATSGTLIVGENVEWTNTGLFYVGSHWGGFWETLGSVEFLPGSVFNSTSTGFGQGPNDPNGNPIAADVRIGQGGAGTVLLHEGAVWNHTGQPNQVNFTVADSGGLVINGHLFNNTSAGVSGEVLVEGPFAQWQIGGQNNSLDVAGFGGAPADLTVTQGGRAFFDGSGFIGIGNSGGASGQATVGHADDFETSILSSGVGLIEVGTFSNQFTGPGQGSLTVNANGRVETDRLTLGRSGGVGHVTVHEGGEILVGGFFGFFNTLEVYQDSTIDVSSGGKIVVGSDTAPLLNPIGGTPNEFDSITEGTVLVGANGILKGAGTIVGNVVVADGGTINAGHSPGTLNITGDLTLEPGGVLTIEVGNATTYDRINVTGLLTLGGTLHIAFIDGFSPTEGEDFNLDIFGSANLAGAFTGVTSAGLGENLFTDVDLEALATGQPLQFTVVPEPASLALLLVGVTALRRRGMPRA